MWFSEQCAGCNPGEQISNGRRKNETLERLEFARLARDKSPHGESPLGRDDAKLERDRPAYIQSIQKRRICSAQVVCGGGRLSTGWLPLKYTNC